MADANTEITIDGLHQAITDAVKAQFPAYVTCEFYRTDRSEAMQAPACLLEMTEFENSPGDDPGTEQLAVMARFEAMLIFGFRTQAVKLEARKAAAAFAAWLRLNRFGMPIGPAQVIGAYPDEFDPDLEKFEVWRVEWQQIIHLGETVWKGGIRPSIVLFSHAPLIGTPHVDDYKPVDPNT